MSTNTVQVSVDLEIVGTAFTYWGNGYTYYEEALKRVPTTSAHSDAFDAHFVFCLCRTTAEKQWCIDRAAQLGGILAVPSGITKDS